MLPSAIDLEAKLARIEEHWKPGIVAQLNDHHLKLAKIKGEYVWHQHSDSDEAFLVIDGSMVIDFREGSVELSPGTLCVIPTGLEHRPRADDTCHILLIEVAGTINTGDAQASDKTTAGEWI